MTARTKTRSRSKERIIDGRYRLGEVRAERSSYLIYDGVQMRPERPVTIKLARGRGVKHREVQATFEREAAIRRAVDHPALAEVVELGTYGVGRPYAVWCRPEGERLSDLPAEEHASVAVGLLELLRTLHETGVSCGDLPPDAVVRTPSGRIVIDDLPEASMSLDGTVPQETIRRELERLERAYGAPGRKKQLRTAMIRAHLSRWSETLIRWGRTPIVLPDLSRVPELLRMRRAPPAIYAVAGSLALATAGVVAARSIDREPTPSPEVAVQPEVIEESAPVSVDSEALAALEKARDLMKAGRHRRAARAFGRVVHRDPDLLKERDVVALVDLLAMPSRGTLEAEWSLVRLGDRALPALGEVWRSKSRGDYHRRRAGEVMTSLGRPVDLVPLWIAGLGSDRCAVRRLSVTRLKASHDPRARRPLEALAARDGWFTSYCGAEEAEEALDAVAWNTPKSKRSS